MRTPNKPRKIPLQYDYWLLIAVAALLAIGLLLLTSASLSISEKLYQTPLYFLLHQISYLVLGIMVALVVLKIPLILWAQSSGYLLLASISLLILVLVPGLGRQINGSTRWLALGPLTLQVSEFAKFAVILYSAGYLVRRLDEVRAGLKGFIKPLILLGLIALLLLLEPDFGAVVVMIMTLLGMMYLAGAKLWQFLVLLVLVGASMGMLAIISPYRLLRLTAFLNPWAQPFDSGYQLVQALIAFGRGGVFGTGLGNSIQKLFYLPEAHTDFLFAILAEEFGIVGQLVVLTLFVWLVARALLIGRRASLAQNLFASYLAYGFGLLLGLQALINMGVNLGLLPTKGLTLPFMSYGGSSMLFNCLIVAILLRINHEATQGKLANSLPNPYSTNQTKKRPWPSSP